MTHIILKMMVHCKIFCWKFFSNLRNFCWFRFSDMITIYYTTAIDQLSLSTSIVFTSMGMKHPGDESSMGMKCPVYELSTQGTKRPGYETSCTLYVYILYKFTLLQQIHRMMAYASTCELFRKDQNLMLSTRHCRANCDQQLESECQLQWPCQGIQLTTQNHIINLN